MARLARVVVSGPPRHVAVCRSGDRVQLFVNGVPDPMGWVALPAWANVSAAGEPFRVGATGYMGYPNGDSLYGLLDEVRLSSTARYVPPERFTPDDSGQENH
ncbi:MAG: LamG domain-containing protein, partial [Planctomycetes bacterium]|nr:LamG domain-containing protein [Planctomycetota bacterium]